MAADMPESHQKYMTCNEDDFRVWTMSAGPMAERVVAFFLESGKAPEQGYKACASLMKLGGTLQQRTPENGVYACSRIRNYALDSEYQQYPEKQAGYQA